MPDRPLQVAVYAAGASLAAATLVYVFGPTFFLDSGEQNGSDARATRKRGVVGLSNPANDCFINSVLQCLAGLPELREFLAREVHLRRLGGREIWDLVEESEHEGEEAGSNEKADRAVDEQAEDPVAPFKDREQRRNAAGKAQIPDWKVRGLQHGLITAALKDMLDGLNERPIQKKTLSAQPFVTQIQTAFRTRLNRNQQDAQEMLQLVTERLADEYRAGRRAKKRATQQGKWSVDRQEADLDEKHDTSDAPQESKDALIDTGFPFEGKIESTIECMHCHFQPKPSTSSFVTLTLHVPQGGSNTTLEACFDNILKVEHIDDFICARCQIQHALDVYQAKLSRTSSGSTTQSHLQADVAALRECLSTDPEKPPTSVTLPESSQVPRRRIARHSAIARYPRVLAVHLSRSMWDAYSSSSKNTIKVTIPEQLVLGGILRRVKYRLLGVVTHKGGHDSGHYESFRRQVLREPFAVSRPALGANTSMFDGVGGSSSPVKSTDPADHDPLATVMDNDKDETSIHERKPSLSAVPEHSSNTELDANVAVIDSATSTPITLATRPSLSVPDSHTEATSLDISTRSGSSTSRATSPASPSKSGAGRPLRSKASLRGLAGLVRLGSNGTDGSAGARHNSTDEAEVVVAATKSAQEQLQEKARKKEQERERKRRKDALERWWRISDDKIKECSTRDVLRMEREVYLLFYELVGDEET